MKRETKQGLEKKKKKIDKEKDSKDIDGRGEGMRRKGVDYWCKE